MHLHACVMCLHLIAVGTAPATRTAHGMVAASCRPKPGARHRILRTLVSSCLGQCHGVGFRYWNPALHRHGVYVYTYYGVLSFQVLYRERRTNVWQDFRGGNVYLGLFTSPPNPKYFLLHPSHQIFRRMHEALNVGKKDN
jgi:hypothetical protein